MAHIYNRSFLNIVAVETTDANSGVPYVNDVDFAANKYPGHDSSVRDGDLARTMLYSTFESRGWSFQEILLSRRRLFTFTNRIVLHCGIASWYRGLSDNWETPKSSPSFSTMLPMSLPRLAIPVEPSIEVVASHLLFYKNTGEAYS
ncbi:hypothetical protein MPH_11768 [Macrophomina phaseolina MS6]|uniref:Uncharacterized protein n=1 Tax=Macrophomina phaseolina (strain MS6) TaxID=1126212 RepID=K2S360_MACPH|nr:hypothetical protein MPH_11768 [Macrophomina phaseolina MS6]